MEKESHIYHTFLKEFRGTSAEVIIHALYEDSKQNTDESLQDWWNYQKLLWKRLYNLTVPDSPYSENASQKLLDILLEVGALELGERPLRKQDIGTGRGR